MWGSVTRASKGTTFFYAFVGLFVFLCLLIIVRKVTKKPKYEPLDEYDN